MPYGPIDKWLHRITFALAITFLAVCTVSAARPAPSGWVCTTYVKY